MTTAKAESAKAYLADRITAELALAADSGTSSGRALHEGKAAGLCHALKDHRQCSELMGTLARYRGTNADRAQEGFRIGNEVAEAVLEAAKALAR